MARPPKVLNRGALAAIAMVLLALQGTTSAWSKGGINPYNEAIPESYPIPIPVTTVSRLASLKPFPSLAALPPGAVAKAGSASGSVRIELMQVVRSDEIAGVAAPNGMEAVILFTRWTNVHPKQKVSKASLDSAGDRSAGAGGLFSGGGKDEMVDMDVAYKVPLPARHLWLIAGGEAFPLRPESAELPDGMVTNKAFGIARMGEMRDARMGWFVPKGMNDIELRLFDYDNGHISLAVAGDMKKAERPSQTKPVDAGKSGELELAVLGIRNLGSYAGQKAPAGWRYVAIDLLGKSIATQGKIGALLFADPAKYIWLSGDGGTLHYGLPPADGTGSIVFTPEVASRQSVAFAVPDNEKHFRLGIRGRSDVLALKATSEPPAAAPTTATQVKDTGTLSLGLVGLRREGGITILDLLATPESGGKGVEIDAGQQFILKAGKSEYRPDAALTRRLFRQPPEPFILPPGTPARFELAYALPEGAPVPSQLRYRGFSGEASLPLDGVPVAEAKPGAGSMSLTALKPVVVATVPEAAIQAASVAAAPAASGGGGGSAPAAGSGATQAPVKPKYVPATEKPKLMAITLPPFDASTAVTEKEPNDRPEQAGDLGKGLAARGMLGQNDEYDWFSFAVEGEPQLWSVEAEGAGVRGVGIYAAGNRQLAWYEAGSKLKVRLDNLLLVPGRYSLRVRGTAKGGEYHVRAVPLGRPDKTAEFEPNDDVSLAQLLRFGEPRLGLINHESDIDSYRFSLDAPTHLLLSLAPPANTKLVMSIQGGTLNHTGSKLAGPGEATRYEALLQPGEYSIRVKSADGSFSSTPYELKLEYLDPFVLPTDLEPNDTAAQASLLSNVRHFQGSAGEFGDWDWFRLPAVTQPTRMSLHFTGGSGISLRKAENGRVGSAELKETSRTDNERFYETVLAPGVPTFLSVSNRGAYSVDMTLDPEPAAISAPAVDPALSLAFAGQLPPLATFRGDQQSVPLKLTVTNHTSTPQRVRLESASFDSHWQVEASGALLDLAPGKSGQLRATLRGDADLPPGDRIPVYVRARSDTTASETLKLPVRAACDAPLQDPQPDMPLPASMLGGFDVAWTSLGAEPEGDSHQKELFDGMSPLGQYYTIRNYPADITVRLAGGAVRIAGITLFAAPYKVDIGSVPFTLLTSSDGSAYHEVMQGTIEPVAHEQVFALPSPVEASHVRLHLDKAGGLEDGPITSLAEFKVIAMPGTSPFGQSSPNIADPVLGGHLVQISWSEAPESLKTMLTEKAEKRSSHIEPLISVDWVIGFHHERAARITRLEWQNGPEIKSGERRPEQLTVSVSMESPNGPWEPVANWKVKQGANERTVLELDAPRWARYLRFSTPGNDTGAYWQLAETLRIFEEPVSASYRSILAEWGNDRPDAYYERSVAVKTSSDTGVLKAGNDRKSAPALTRSEVAAGKVKAGERVDWYRIDVPKGMDRIELTFRGDGADRLEPSLEDAKGNPARLEIGDAVAGGRIFHAKVEPGASFYLKVEEAKRSIIFLMDESGSIGASTESIYQAINQMAGDINPLVESVNLMSLGDGDVQPLIGEWSSNPLQIKTALASYDRSGGSSNAENTLISAMKLLSSRQGNHIIILMTDAVTGGGTLNHALWEQFRKVNPRVFTFELQAANQSEGAAEYQDKMQDWAAANHGDYRMFHTQADLDHAYERAACLMRRPAEYQVSWKPAPGAGRLSVAWEKGKAMAGATIELILDASGSMRSSKHKVDGKLKIDVAKEVMKQIVDIFPDDTQVGLRVYGHRSKSGSKAACEDSELITPIGKLDRKKLNEQIMSVNALGDTPIAYSLQKAGNDLARITGPRHIVLITDGKEECNGDPAKAVEELRARGVDARIDIVGFALTDKKDKADMDRVAGKSGGRFFDAQNRDGLAASISEALAMPFVVLDGRDSKAGEGLTGQGTQTLYQGHYTVVVHTAKGDVTIRDVTLSEGRTTRVTLYRDGERIGYRVGEETSSGK